jgi:hypothetical protein
MISNSSTYSSREIFVSFLFSLFFGQAKAEQFKMNQGIALTEFTYQNDQVQSFQELRRGFGLAFRLSYHKSSPVDSSKYNLEQTPFSIYLGQNPKVVKLLSMVNYDLGFQFMRLNAVGAFKSIKHNLFNFSSNPYSHALVFSVPKFQVHSGGGFTWKRNYCDTYFYPMDVADTDVESLRLLI